MGERTTSPDHFSNNPAYAAILKNQQLWNDMHPGFRYGHELRALSARVERSLKRVFAGYIDPVYPQIAINLTLGYHPKAYEDSFTYTPFRFPANIAEDDHPYFEAGMFELNEWATAYATSYYWEKMEKGPITTPLMRGYQSMNHSALDIGSAPHATKIMEDVANTASEKNANFDDAVFKALFRHDTSDIDLLISTTDTVQSHSLEELAIEIARRPKKKLAEAVMGYSTQARGNDSWIKSTTKKALTSVFMHGWQATPGIVEVNLAMETFGPTLGTSLAATGNISGALVAGVAGTIMTSFFYPSTTIHESIHGYSLSSTHHGIMPIALEKT